MPLLDHFHPPLHGPRRWEGFHHAWATFIAQQLNQETLPPDYFAESEIRIGQEMDAFEIRASRNGACRPELRAVIELVSPANKDRPEGSLTFASKCAGYLKRGTSVAIVDVVTSKSANLHAELLKLLEVEAPAHLWESPTGLYSAAYRIAKRQSSPHLEAWTEALALGAVLPVVPLWLSLDLCVPLRLEDSYLAACRSLRIPA